ncbi:hypothetical protein [Chitinophaga niabensis]|nr:hypothetical protein [Chitinophaga niabensis]
MNITRSILCLSAALFFTVTSSNAQDALLAAAIKQRLDKQTFRRRNSPE